MEEHKNGEEFVKPFPSAIVADFARKDTKGGAFSAPEEAFDNLVNEAEKRNPYFPYVVYAILTVDDITFERGRDYLNNKRLSDVFRVMAKKYLENTKEFLESLDENKPEEDMLKLTMWLDPELYSGSGLDVINDHARGISQYVGSLIHTIENCNEFKNVEFPEIVYNYLKKWSIPELQKEMTVNGPIMQEDIKPLPSRKYRILKYICEKLSEPIKIPTAIGVALTGSEIASQVFPDLVRDIGYVFVQNGFGTTDMVTGRFILAGLIGLGTYGFLTSLFRKMKYTVKDIENKVRENKLRVEGKDGRTFDSSVEWLDYIGEVMMNERLKEHYDSLKSYLKDAMQIVEERIEEIYRKVREAEDRGYIPKTIGEICKNYRETKRYYGVVILDNPYASSAKNAFADAGLTSAVKLIAEQEKNIASKMK